MLEKSKKHLSDSKAGYWEHLKFAIYASALLLWAAIASLLHAIVPALFPGTSAFIVIKLYKQRLENHPNPRYKDWVENGIDN